MRKKCSFAVFYCHNDKNEMELFDVMWVELGYGLEVSWKTNEADKQMNSWKN